MRPFVELVIRRRAWVLGLCVVLTALGLWSLSHAVLATELGKMFLGEDPRFERYLELSARFGNDEVIAVGIEDPAALSPAGLERLSAAVADVRSVSGVRRVGSLLEAVYVEPGSFLPRAVRYADAARSAPERAGELQARLARDPLAGGLLVSEDGGAIAVLVELDASATRQAEGLPALVDAVVAPFASRYPAGAVHPAGMPSLAAETLRQTVIALAVCTPVVSLVLLLSVWLLFGRLWPAAISLGVAVVAMVWTLGVAVQLDPQLNIMMSFVPAVILIISFSDIVHLCSAYLIELGAGLEREEALLAACSEVGRACLFTSLTTFVGFVCLSLIPVPVFRVLGVVLGLGVGVALLLAVTLVPILFSYLPAPTPLRTAAGEGPRPRTERIQAVLDRVLAACERLAVGRPHLVNLAFLAATALALAGASRLTIETDFVERLTRDNQVRRDQEWFMGRFLAADALQVYVFAPSPAALDDPTWLGRVAALQAAARELEDVRGARSLVDVVGAVERALPGGEAGGVPREPARLRSILRLLGALGGDSLRPLIDRERGVLRMLVHPRGTGMRTASRIAGEVERLAGVHLAGAGRAEASGLLPLFGGFLDQVVRAQRDGLLLSCLTIAALMALGLRSLRVGVTSMLPNLFPLIVLAGCLGALYDRVDSDTIALTFLALGIGVDDTIHFLSRYRLEVARGGSPSEAIGRTFTFAGRGIVMTTLILSCGFIPFLISDYYFMRMIGSLLPLCFLVALLADLLWIPALARLGWLRYDPPGGAS